MSGALENKLGGHEKGEGLGVIMRPGIILALVLISVFSLGALLALSGFAGDLRSKNNGRAHALSDSAIGYAGIVELLRGNDINVELSREELGADAGRTLRVITLSRPYQMPDRKDLDPDVSTLIVLPKWYVYPVKERPGWVQQAPAPIGPLFGPETFKTPLADFGKNLKIAQVEVDDGTLTYDLKSNVMELPMGRGFNIKNLQTLEGENLVSVMTANDRIVLGLVENTSIYILSDPDLLNTMGIALKTRARFGYDLLNGLAAAESRRAGTLTFDLSVHGFGRTQNLIKTLLTPPFLAATLCLLAAGFLIAWQAFARFGDPVTEERDYELGKYTLADNGARFIRIAQKEVSMADGYRNLMRRLVAKDFYMDRQSHDAIDDFLENREQKLNMSLKWKPLTQALLGSEDRAAFLITAKDMHKWRQEIKDEHQ